MRAGNNIKKVSVIMLLMVFAMTMGLVTGGQNRCRAVTREEVKRKISEAKKELKERQAEYDALDKGTKGVALASIISFNPFVVKASFLDNSYYWITNPSNSWYNSTFKTFSGVIKPTGSYRYYNGITCVEAKEVNIPPSMKKKIDECKNRVDHLEGALSEKVIFGKEPCIGMGKKQKMKYSLLNGTADYNKIQWKSSNTKVVSIDSKGMVKGKKLGTATITAYCSVSKKTSKCKLKVVRALGSLSFDETKLTLYKGEKYQLTTICKPGNSNEKLYYTSSNPKVADVSSKGLVTTGKVGKATITVKSSLGKKAVCKVNVKQKITDLHFEQEVYNINLYSKQDNGINYDYKPSWVEDPGIQFSIDNPAVAQISDYNYESVWIKGLSIGTCTLTASIPNGETAQCTINIIDGRTVSFKSEKYTIDIDEGEYVIPCDISAYFANEEITVTSSDENILTIKRVEIDDIDGNYIYIKPVSLGTCVITITASNGSTAQCTVTLERYGGW